jgi:uncharacterized protein
MMKYKILRYLVVLLAISFIAAGCQSNSNSLSEGGPSANGNSTSEQTAATPSSISIQALSEKKFDGRDLTLGSVQAETSTYTRYYTTYKSGELTISGIMNVPKGNGPFPIVVMNHGYIDPAIYTNGRGLRREQDYFASRGYIVVHPDYRNHAQSSKDENVEGNVRLGYVEDVINAIYALKAANLSYADTNRIAMIGHSMGGGIAQAIMVSQPELVKAYMLYAPVSTDTRESYYRWTESRPEAVEQINNTFGSPEKNPEFWDNVSPVNFLSKVKSPVMINHGTADADVPLEWSQRTYDALRKENKEVIFHQYPGEGHEFGPAWPTVMQRTLDFFNSSLK